MKKTLSLLLAVAVTLGFMACKNNPNEPHNPDAPVVPADGSYALSFNGEAWQPDTFYVYDRTERDYVSFTFFRGETAEVVMGTMMVVPGEYDHTTSKGDYVMYLDPENDWVDVDGVAGDAGKTHGRWRSDMDSFKETITEFDLNAMTMTVSWQQDFFDSEAYAYASEAERESLKRYTMRCSFVNYHFVWSIQD